MASMVLPKQEVAILRGDARFCSQKEHKSFWHESGKKWSPTYSPQVWSCEAQSKGSVLPGVPKAP
jgi:hypothetical protein